MANSGGPNHLGDAAFLVSTKRVMAFLSALLLRLVIAAALASAVFALPASANANACHTTAVGPSAEQTPAPGAALPHFDHRVTARDCLGCAHPSDTNHAGCDMIDCCFPAALVGAVPALVIDETAASIGAGNDSPVKGIEPEAPQEPPRLAG